MLLTLAELHLDAGVHAGQQQSPSTSPSCSHLQASADWLALAQEAMLLNPRASDHSPEGSQTPGSGQPTLVDLPTEQPDSEEGLHQDLAQVAVRFSWASARLADCRKDHEASTLQYTNTLIALEVFQSNAIRSAELTGEEPAEVAVTLPYSQQDSRICTSSVLAKLQVLQLQEISREALTHLEADDAHAALEILQHELLHDADFACKAAQHDPAHFSASLKLLLVGAPGFMPRLNLCRCQTVKVYVLNTKQHL